MTSSVTGRGVDPDPGELRNALVHAGFVHEPPTTVSTTVLDTFDGRLHAAGLRLVRRGGVLALSGSDTVTAEVPVERTPRFATDLPPGPFRSRLAAVVEIRALLPLVTVTSHREQLARRNGDGKVVATAQIHDRVSAGSTEIDGWFVEVDELTGYQKQTGDLLDLVMTGRAEALDDDLVTLAMAAAGVDPAGHLSDPSVPLEADLPALEGFRRVLENLRREIEANRPGTVSDIDPEFLHDLRVAVRRTRSVLGHGKRVLPERTLEWARDDFKSLGTLTGPARDLDVYVLEWDQYVDALPAATVRALQPVRNQLDVDRAEAHRELSIALRSAFVEGLLDRWRANLGHPADRTDGGPRSDRADGGPHADHPIGTVVGKRIDKAQRRLLEHGRAITPETPAEDVHELRKDAKKLRYLLECFAGLLPGDERKAFVKRLKALQDNLGEHQDAEVHAAQLRQTVGELPAGTPPETYVAIGRLIEQLEQRRQRARDEFAERFAEYDRPGAHRAFAAVLDGIGG